MRGRFAHLIILLCVASACGMVSVAAAQDDPNTAAARAAAKAWDVCAATEAVKQAKTGATAEEGADASMAACRDKGNEFIKALEAPPLNGAPADADAAARTLSDRIRAGKVSLINDLRKG